MTDTELKQVCELAQRAGEGDALKAMLAALTGTKDAAAGMLRIYEMRMELDAYRSTDLMPDQIREMDRLYRQKCIEVERLKKAGGAKA